jgi:hypothetical protein
MLWRMCWKLKDHREICVDLLALAETFRWHDPRLGEPTKPDPRPWIMDELLDKTVVKDLTILATMDQLTAELSPAFKKNLQAAVKAEMKKMPLPAGVTLQEMKPGK